MHKYALLLRRENVLNCRRSGAGRAVAPWSEQIPGFSLEPLSGHGPTVWFAIPGRRFRCYRCLTYQRSTVSMCPFHDKVNCQQPGAGTSISEG